MKFNTLQINGELKIIIRMLQSAEAETSECVKDDIIRLARSKLFEIQK